MSDTVPAKKIGEPKDPLGPDESPRITVMRSETKTPKKQSEPSTSSSALKDKDRGDTDKESDQGNGCHNPPDLPVSPGRGSSRLGVISWTIWRLLNASEGCVPKIKNVTAEGAVEFHRPSMKKLQTETKWRRPCKLGIAYSSTNCNDCTIYLIIYEGNVKCRRNLMKDFEAEEPEN
ncbi:hypothetical protein NQ317_006069 [Molorchus minor]|uniref:Uncharacterized protein n=1 Tax=Molorchus minor TaxID=1323400 RepID=A0ABQ9K4X6_9CUCU|nr:hypothetical protein NQ317_006069 [Molorchus minor]